MGVAAGLDYTLRCEAFYPRCQHGTAPAWNFEFGFRGIESMGNSLKLGSLSRPPQIVWHSFKKGLKGTRIWRKLPL